MANLTPKDRTRARNRGSNGHTDGRLPASQQPELVPYTPFTCFPQSQPEGPAPQMHTVRAEHHGTEALPHTYTYTRTHTTPSLKTLTCPAYHTHLPAWGPTVSMASGDWSSIYTRGTWDVAFQANGKGLTQKESSTSHTRASNVEMSSFPWEGNYKNALKMFTMGRFWNNLSLTSNTPKPRLCLPWHLVLDHCLFYDWLHCMKLHCITRAVVDPVEITMGCYSHWQLGSSYGMSAFRKMPRPQP